MDIREWNIRDFENEPSIIYCNDNLFFGDSMKVLPEQMIGCRMRFEMGIYCRKGKFRITLEEKEYKVEEGQLFIYGEDFIINECLLSADIELCVIGFSWNYCVSTLLSSDTFWPMIDYLMDTSVITLAKEANEAFKLCFNYLHDLCLSDNDLFREDLINNIVQSLFYEFVRNISREIREVAPKDLGIGNQQTRIFFDILASHRGLIRTVTEVANLMNLTPKYLSKIIKENTSQTPMRHIHAYMMRAIEQELRYTEKSIKEIAFQHKFPSLAFFGKFVKQQTGMSPTAYRQSLMKSVTVTELDANMLST